MTLKPQRNERCHCGSGKKYKQCCGRLNVGATATAQPADSRLSVQVLPVVKPTEPDPCGHPAFDPDEHADFAVHGHFSKVTHVATYCSSVPVIGKITDPDPAGYPGSYDVEFTFQEPAKLGHIGNTVSMNTDEPGSSLLVLIPEDVKDRANTSMRIRLIPEGSCIAELDRFPMVELKPNSDGLLATAMTSVVAENASAAAREATGNLTGFLDRMAFAYDVPLHVTRVRVQEVATGTTHLTLTFPPYQRFHFHPAHPTMAGPAAPSNSQVLSYYHEALKSQSPIYQFICYLKAIELVYGLRGKRKAETVASGRTPRTESETLTETKWLRKNIEDKTLLAEIMGRKYTWIIEKLRATRNKISHAFLQDDPDATPSLEDLHNEVYKHLPVVHYIARKLVTSEAQLSIDANF